ncbi:vacuolar sorting protein VPS33/slp1 [Geranomyces variabilis]|uniref:Vacuolar sorting protein VPS33/slp1 n=1 Tax=Geranomyces variabilis TaxID=109894 RepID=A0AAD5TKQ0_9FUNG|nr:vacuolar sorting protein VPS33/slp1 [Geranomyces variabilis]
MTSLKEIMKKRILNDMIQSVQPANRWKIIVVDPKSVKILKNACRMHDILEENVTLVEDITRKRQPYPTKEAIYFISPTESSVQRLIDDFPPTPTDKKEAKKAAEMGPRMYAVGHVYFTSALSDALFNKIKASAATAHIKALKEMNVDFIVQESQVFTLDQPSSALALYSPLRDGARQAEILVIAKKIASTLATLGDYPYIRYYASPTPSVPQIPMLVAQAVQRELDDLARQDSDFPPPSPYKRSVLIITDRTLDMMSPILHEFTYQAMMNDLLVLEGGRYVYKAEPGESTAPDLDSNKNNVTASLDENDPIWMLIRHWHYADAVDYIRNTFNKFLTENHAASSAMQREGGGSPTDAGGIESIKAMKDTLSSLPQFQDMKSKFSAHINICQECKTMFERRQLDLVAAVEQDLATGETSKGRAIKFSQTMVDMVPALDSPNVTSADKLRLLMLYIIAQNGIDDEERRRLLGYAKLSLEESQAITNLSYWGVRMGKEKGEKDQKGKYAYHVHGKKRKAGEAEPAYDLSRWNPVLKSVLEDQLTGQLDTTLFPWLTEPAPDSPRSNHPVAASSSARAASQPSHNKHGLAPPDPQFPSSLRTTRPSWAARKRPKANSESSSSPTSASSSTPTPDAQAGDIRKNGARIIVFALGGVTYSELRIIYAIRAAFQRDVLLGSTHIAPPAQWIEFLKQMGKADVPTGDESEAASPGVSTPASASSASASALKRSETSGSIGKKKGLRGMFGKKDKEEKS